MNVDNDTALTLSIEKGNFDMFVFCNSKYRTSIVQYHVYSSELVIIRARECRRIVD